MPDDMGRLLRQLNENVHDISLKLAVADERWITISQMLSKIEKLDRQLVALVGPNGDKGDIADVMSRLTVVEGKVSSLVLSRATFAGYLTAAGGTGAALVKYLLPNW